MNKTTGELLKLLKSNTLDSYLSDNAGEFAESPMCSYINAVIEEKNLKKSDIIKKSGIQTNYAYQILSGLKKPSRDKLLSLCIGMNLTSDEAQTLLKHCGYSPLYPRNKRDCIIISALESHISVVKCNIILDDYNLSPL